MYIFDVDELFSFDVCGACNGNGGHDIGDCEEGVWEMCDDCDGTGVEEC